jgi:hypothetical protein
MRRSALHHGHVNFAYGVEEISLPYDIAITLGIEEIPRPNSNRLICGDTTIKFGVEKMILSNYEISESVTSFSSVALL